MGVSVFEIFQCRDTLRDYRLFAGWCGDDQCRDCATRVLSDIFWFLVAAIEQGNISGLDGQVFVVQRDAEAGGAGGAVVGVEVERVRDW